jgi:hypothetical protein
MTELIDRLLSSAETYDLAGHEKHSALLREAVNEICALKSRIEIRALSTEPGEAVKGPTDGMLDATALAAARSAFRKAEENPNMIDCQTCNGRGYHHGFGEDGADPDWCSNCGGGGYDMTEDEQNRPIDEAIRAYLATLTKSSPVEAVAVKGLEWHGPDFEEEYWAAWIGGRYTIGADAENGKGRWLSGVGGYFPDVEAAKAAAQSDYEMRIRSALATLSNPEAPAARVEALAGLKKAEQFITNGIDIGFIRMPDPGTPDPAHDTLPAIRDAIDALSAALVATPPAPTSASWLVDELLKPEAGNTIEDVLANYRKIRRRLQGSGSPAPTSALDVALRIPNLNTDISEETKVALAEVDAAMRAHPLPKAPIETGVVEALREALAFYANPEIYKAHPHGLAFDDRDLSYVARQALEAASQARDGK